MKAETKRIAIHDESGLFVKEFIAQNNSKSEYKYLDLSLIDAQFLKDSITNENYEGVLLIQNTNVADLENKIKFISNSSPSIVLLKRFKISLPTKSLKQSRKSKFRYFSNHPVKGQYKLQKLQERKCKRP
jgi:ABC-2 type transport system permease protein